MRTFKIYLLVAITLCIAGFSRIDSGGVKGFRSSDGSWQPLRLDKATNSIQTIDYAHHEIHAGSAFTCNFGQTAPTNSGEMTIIAFTTPNTTKWIHMFSAASSTAASFFAVYEISDLDAAEGTDLTPYNHNRNSTTASTVLSLGAVATANKATSFTVAQAAGATLDKTTAIYKRYLGAAATGKDTAGETRSDNEFILKQNTQYAFVVESTTGDDNTHNIVLNWYEHTDISN